MKVKTIMLNMYRSWLLEQYASTVELDEIEYYLADLHRYDEFLEEVNNELS